VSFVVRVHPPALPELPLLADEVARQLGLDVEIDEASRLAAQAGERESTWCPWPMHAAAMFVPGATTRGVELLAGKGAAGAEVRVSVPALATWADWRLGINLACLLAGDGAAVVEGEGQFLAAGLRRHFEDADDRYLSELAEGAVAVAAAAAEGRVARVGGPGGYAAVGPRTWMDLADVVEDPEDLPMALVERIRASIERRGYEAYHPANPMWLDGRSGREVLAALLPPEVDTLLRDPEFVLVSEDLEAVPGVGMFLLRFEHLETALGGRATWLDDRTAAIPAIPRAEWPRLFERMRPMLVEVERALDG